MKKVTKSFATSAIALVFAVIGYQTALLVHYAAVARIVATNEHPDTVYTTIVQPSVEQQNARQQSVGQHVTTERHSSANHDRRAKNVVQTYSKRRTESFRFNPNTASVEEFMRLGFSEKQAESIISYRNKGGKFRRKEDFAKSYVVSDSVYKRLESYIDIPLLDINKADSAAFDTLPGIGAYFARKMVEYRKQLHGYSFPEQLMDIYNFSQEKYDALKDLITVGETDPYPLWSMPADSLRIHPYIRTAATARGIVFYREHNPDSLWSIKGLKEAGIITEENACKLERCKIR